MNRRMNAEALTFGVGLDGGRGGGGGGGGGEEAGMGAAEKWESQGPERGKWSGGCGGGGGEEAAAGQHLAGEVDVAGGRWAGE